MGSLWAWNAFITPLTFYQLHFRGTALESSFLPTLTSTFTLVGLLAMLALLPLQHRTSERRRILGSLCVLVAVFALLTLFALYPLLLVESSSTLPSSSTTITITSSRCWAP